MLSWIKCIYSHFWLTYDLYYLVLSSRAVTEQPGQLPFFWILWRTSNFFSCNRVIFTDCKFLVSLAILKTFCLCIIYLLILSLVPRSFILGQTQFILQSLFKKTFHILAKKQAFAKWNSCMEFFQNHVFQSEVQPKNYPGSHISCHAFQSFWQAAESTVCQTPTSILPRARVFKDVLSTLVAT